MRLKIALLKGDGIGGEVVSEAVKVLRAVACRFDHQIEFTEALIGASAIDACGDPYPEATHRVCVDADAVLLGAVGDPRFDNNPAATVRPEQGLLRMRSALGLYANLRPLTIYDELAELSPLRGELVRGVDCLFVRELTGGIYFGRHERTATGAIDTCEYSVTEVDRILRVGFENAAARKGRLTVVDKANVLETSRLWRERAQKMAVEYLAVTVNYMFVDNAAMQIVSHPADFDVVVTENMFGDILTDLASVISGSIGLLPSASIGSCSSLFEPIHGSWPEGAGRGVANPIAAILSAAMLVEHKGFITEGVAIRGAVLSAINERVLTPELGGTATTSEIGNYISEKIHN